MGCYSRNFTLSILRDKPYFNRLSKFLIEQVVGLSCNSLAYFTRALDALEEGKPTTRFPGDFGQAGLLAGYGHVHFKREDWAACNLALENRLPVTLSIDDALEQIVQSLLQKGKGYEGVKATAERFADRASSRATGDWVIYRNGDSGFEYLAIHEHTERGSAEEQSLRRLLDALQM
ncbi:hypothetical protein EGJ27_08495 [Pseudomonas sp. v388]|nr:hypothetical protein EGJ27_08495 [Pseudomonas sp. v388]